MFRAPKSGLNKLLIVTIQPREKEDGYKGKLFAVVVCQCRVLSCDILLNYTSNVAAAWMEMLGECCRAVNGSHSSANSGD